MIWGLVGTVKPATLATTRLAEHWAHGLDIAGPAGAEWPDTDRLRHIAWLAHRTLPYAFGLAGQPPVPGALRADRAGRLADLAVRAGRRRIGDYRGGRGVLPGGGAAARPGADRAPGQRAVRRHRAAPGADLRGITPGRRSAAGRRAGLPRGLGARCSRCRGRPPGRWPAAFGGRQRAGPRPGRRGRGSAGRAGRPRRSRPGRRGRRAGRRAGRPRPDRRSRGGGPGQRPGRRPRAGPGRARRPGRSGPRAPGAGPAGRRSARAGIRSAAAAPGRPGNPRCWSPASARHRGRRTRRWPGRCPRAGVRP